MTHFVKKVVAYISLRVASSDIFVGKYVGSAHLGVSGRIMKKDITITFRGNRCELIIDGNVLRGTIQVHGGVPLQMDIVFQDGKQRQGIVRMGKGKRPNDALVMCWSKDHRPLSFEEGTLKKEFPDGGWALVDASREGSR